jgi:hypothetical protein
VPPSPAAQALAEQQAVLQRHVEQYLKTQQLIVTTERTVQELQGSLAAFQNNPQAHAVAATTMQAAQSHVQAARALVVRLHASLQEHGVSWDDASGRITHIHNEPLQQARAAAGGSRRNADGGRQASAAAAAATSGGRRRSSSSSSSSSGDGGSSRKTGSSSNGLGDVVRSQRRGNGNGSASRGTAGHYVPVQSSH